MKTNFGKAIIMLASAACIALITIPMVGSVNSKPNHVSSTFCHDSTACKGKQGAHKGKCADGAKNCVSSEKCKSGKAAIGAVGATNTVSATTTTAVGAANEPHCTKATKSCCKGMKTTEATNATEGVSVDTAPAPAETIK